MSSDQIGQIFAPIRARRRVQNTLTTCTYHKTASKENDDLKRLRKDFVRRYVELARQRVIDDLLLKIL